MTQVHDSKQSEVDQERERLQAKLQKSKAKKVALRDEIQ
jgi:hypothetical protein